MDKASASASGKEKNEKRKLKKKPSKKQFNRLGRSPAGLIRPALSKEASDVPRNASSATGFVAESGRIVGRKQDKLSFFEKEDFDLESFADLHMATLTEKGIGTLKGELASLQQKCEADAQSTIHSSYSLFVDSCGGVAQVDSEFQQLRALVTGTTSLAKELHRVVQSNDARTQPDVAEYSGMGSKELSNAAGMRVISILEELDVAVAERDFPVAKELLIDASKELEEMGLMADLLSLEDAVDDRRQSVVQLLEYQLQDPTLGANDQTTLLRILASVAGGIHALTFLLSLHSIQISNEIEQLPKPHRTGESGREGVDYAGCLSQICFHGIGLAVEEFRAVFDTSSVAQLSSVFSQWADSEAKQCAEAIRNNALSTFTSLAPTVNCIAFTLVYAQALKNLKCVNVIPTIRKVLFPPLEGLVRRFFEDSGDEIVAMLREEISSMLANASFSDRNASPSNQPMMECSQLLVDRTRYVSTILRPLWTNHIIVMLKTGLKSLLASMIECLANDLKEKVSGEVQMKTMDLISERLMTIVANLVEEQIPRELSSIETEIGPVITRREITEIVEMAARSFGMEAVFAS